MLFFTQSVYMCKYQKNGLPEGEKEVYEWKILFRVLQRMSGF